MARQNSRHYEEALAQSLEPHAPGLGRKGKSSKLRPCFDPGKKNQFAAAGRPIVFRVRSEPTALSAHQESAQLPGHCVQTGQRGRITSERQLVMNRQVCGRTDTLELEIPGGHDRSSDASRQPLGVA